MIYFDFIFYLFAFRFKIGLFTISVIYITKLLLSHATITNT
ncbi:hypothetical protein [uncultured Gammaproteobacteria bacterium]|nr:hypothetical protein [uncultured Gammaproteobacteria bacterium]